jgi:hypothetical protein
VRNTHSASYQLNTLPGGSHHARIKHAPGGAAPSDEQIRRWFSAGLSKRKIKMRLRGSQQQRQERLNRVLGQVNAAGPGEQP